MPKRPLLRIVADLIPLFDSPYGERVVLGGDMNVTTAIAPTAREFLRYEAILRAVESLGLKNLVETTTERPPQFENCLCGSLSCIHLRTYGQEPGYQLDWLFATPELAARCRRLLVADPSSLSDHSPIVAQLNLPLSIPERAWDPDSFVQEVGMRSGSAAGRVAEEIVAWAERKHAQLTRQVSFASLDRLPTSTGPEPELWVQLDLKYPNSLGYTVSLTASGKITMQFQHMKAAPFHTEEARRRVWEEIQAIPNVELEHKLAGRPSFPMAALSDGESLNRFLNILERTVDEMVSYHGRRRAAKAGSQRTDDDLES